MIDYVQFSHRCRRTPGRAFLLVRHGERPAIDPSDPTFGRDLPITEAGRELALSCGRALRDSGPAADWAFLSSHYRRTRLTAAAVAEGMGAAPESVRVSDAMGIPGIYVADSDAVCAHQEAEGAGPYSDRMLRDGRAEGMRPIADIVDALLAWCRGEEFGARRVFAATHDIFLACVLTGLGCARISSAHWVGFLQGVALFERADGGFDAEYCVPDRNSFENVFVQ